MTLKLNTVQHFAAEARHSLTVAQDHTSVRRTASGIDIPPNPVVIAHRLKETIDNATRALSELVQAQAEALDETDALRKRLRELDA